MRQIYSIRPHCNRCAGLRCLGLEKPTAEHLRQQRLDSFFGKDTEVVNFNAKPNLDGEAREDDIEIDLKNDEAHTADLDCSSNGYMEPETDAVLDLDRLETLMIDRNNARKAFEEWKNRPRSPRSEDTQESAWSRLRPLWASSGGRLSRYAQAAIGYLKRIRAKIGFSEVVWCALFFWLVLCVLQELRAREGKRDSLIRTTTREVLHSPVRTPAPSSPRASRHHYWARSVSFGRALASRTEQVPAQSIHAPNKQTPAQSTDHRIERSFCLLNVVSVVSDGWQLRQIYRTADVSLRKSYYYHKM